MSQYNLLYAQSGGVTAVINSTACGVIETARKNQINQVYAAHNGIIGVLLEDLIDTSSLSSDVVGSLRHTPGGSFGSCRYKLSDARQYQRIIDVCKAHNIRYFLYNGGNDSQDTTHKLSEYALLNNYPLQCIGIPKTIDNDLAITDNCPGFGSVAKYASIAILEAGLDVASMAASSTKVFVLEVMGRHTGWIAAGAGLSAWTGANAPHIILFPEVPFRITKFCKHVKQCVDKFGFCTIVASEGIKDTDGNLLSETNSKDAFGHKQLGGVAPIICDIIKQNLGLKYHWAVADYLQRSARHIAAKTDVEQAYAVGKAAVEFAVNEQNAVMPTIERTNNNPYQWQIGMTEVKQVANVEKYLPKDFITADGWHITNKCREYLLPLIQGEEYPPFIDGLPKYAYLKHSFLDKKLPKFELL